MVVEKILERARRRADHAEVYFREYETTTVTFRAGRLHQAGVINGHGAALRVFVGGRVGFAGTNVWDDVDAVVDAACATARYGREARYDLPAGAGPYGGVATFDDAVAGIASATMAAWGEETVDRLKTADARFVVNAEFHKTVGKIRLANDRGLDLSATDTLLSFSVTVQRTAEGDIFYHYAADASPRADIDVSASVARLAREAAWADNVVPQKSGRTDLIFDAPEVPTLLLPLLVCVNGAYLIDGSSVLAAKIGHPVAAPAFNLYDDATSPRGTGAYAFDGEGTPARRNTLVAAGILSSYLTDLATAAELDVTPSGNAQRGLRTPPTPGPANIIVAPGALSRDELIADTRRGILVLQTAGGAMANLTGGEIGATLVFGLKIENGLIVGRVKDCLFAGNVFEMLGARLRAVGRDAGRTEGQYIVPEIVIADQMVTGRS